MTRALIVGASLAALRCAETLRGLGFTGDLTVVGDEPQLPYNRPPLSKDGLVQGLDEGRLQLRSRLTEGDVHWRLGTAAVGADLEARTVTLADGSHLGYDALVIATGLRPTRVCWPGDAPPAAVLKDARDAQALRRSFEQARRVAVVGGGALGAELATSARLLGCSVVLISSGEAVMQRSVGPVVGTVLTDRLRAHGIDVILSRRVVGHEPAGLGSRLILSDGTEVEADVVVQALGGVANTEWLHGTSLDLSDGVLTDAGLRGCDEAGTPVAGVYVAGDLARMPLDRFGGLVRRTEHWQMAVETARLAAVSVCADLLGSTPAVRHPWDGVPSFWSDQAACRIQGVGVPQLAVGPAVLLEGDVQGECLFGYYANSDLVGVVGVNMAARVTAMRREIGVSQTLD